MKRIIVIIVSALLLAGVILGIVFGVKACKEKKAEDGNKQVHIEYLQDEYVVGDTAIVRVVVFSDIEFKSIKYALNNGAEVDMVSKTGESKDHDMYKAGNGKYYIDTQVEIIDISSLTVGDYSVRFYSYDAENTRYVLNTSPIYFEIVASTSNVA